ncbi:MAG: FHA domain-containing protein [Chromatiales bacterium]|nr:FHA domain-containing protein [Chromatiales bacterium]
MTDPTDNRSIKAWLVFKGERIPLRMSFNVGRSQKCKFVLEDDRASREHAMFQYDDAGRRWLIIDLGSTNGTYLNENRLSRPMPLKDGDTVRIGDSQFEFGELRDETLTRDASSIASDRTVIAVNTTPVWLLLADVKGSTRLIQELPQSEVSLKFRMWGRECERIVQASGGMVNEYMGDGLLAFWRDAPDAPGRIATMLREFNALESETGLGFRVICHYGVVAIGAGMSSGVEKLAGKDLNYIFKIEKPAGKTGMKVNLTQAAANRLGDQFECMETAETEVAGFADQHKILTPCF